MVKAGMPFNLMGDSPAFGRSVRSSEISSVGVRRSRLFEAVLVTVRCLLFLGVLGLANGDGMPAGAREEVPKVAMPEEVFRLLLEANRTAIITNHPSRRSFG